MIADAFFAFLSWVRLLFFNREMELALIGLQNAGKTSFVNVVSGGEFVEDMIPTVGFNMRKVTKNKVSIKMWDMGGQERFRNMWERYCRGVTAVVYVLDAADKENFPLAKTELHALMQKPAVAGVPLLVLGNKSDLKDAADARTCWTRRIRRIFH